MRLSVTAVLVSLLGLALAMPVCAARDDNKGKGAGGLRGEHASEMGLEKGKAWAGSKEKRNGAGSEENEAGPQQGGKGKKAGKGK